MIRQFVELPVFQKAWMRMGLTDDDLLALERRLLAKPKAGVVMQGSGGAKKVRFEAQGKGKQGGARIIYVDIVVSETIYLLPFIYFIT